jgi:hypothetical protein
MSIGRADYLALTTFNTRLGRPKAASRAADGPPDPLTGGREGATLAQPMAPETQHKVLVADREPTRRSVTRRALEVGGMTVCAEARDARSAVAAAVRERPDLCLLAVDIE